jgi:hypothetical protein
MMTRFADGRHAGAGVEEWLFTAWADDASLGIVSGHRVVGPTAWYWAALAREGRPLLHVLDDGISVRADPFIVKGEALWAEHSRDAPMEQWSIGNETYAAALDDPGDALGRAYGDRTPIAFDLEWCASAPPSDLACAAGVSGYSQEGAVHGAIEVLGEPSVELDGFPARRWHRWTDPGVGPPPMGPVVMPEAVADGGVRAPFAFPDGTTADLVLAPDGWRRRTVRRC